MKILITGSSGLLGSTLYDYFTNQGEIVERFNRATFSWENHSDNIEKLVNFDCIVHTAAKTNVEACELDPASCYKDNALFTERLAFAASHTNCKFVYISSTGIYGSGKMKDPYTEADVVNPTTHHHRSKQIAELAVNHYLKNALILRTGWIFGGKPDNPKNFVARRIEEALASKTKQIFSNIQQIGVPTCATDFAVKLHEMLGKNEAGTFNVINQGCASRYDYVMEIIKIAGLNVKVLPMPSTLFNRVAQVSQNEFAISIKLQQLGYENLPDWQTSLEKYIRVQLNNWLSQLL